MSVAAILYKDTIFGFESLCEESEIWEETSQRKCIECKLKLKEMNREQASVTFLQGSHSLENVDIVHKDIVPTNMLLSK